MNNKDKEREEAKAEQRKKAREDQHKEAYQDFQYWLDKVPQEDKKVIFFLINNTLSGIADDLKRIADSLDKIFSKM